MTTIKRSWEDGIDHKFNRALEALKKDRALEALKKDRDLYDEETKRQLKEVRDSDWHPTEYLKEILWELRYMRRRANRP